VAAEFPDWKTHRLLARRGLRAYRGQTAHQAAWNLKNDLKGKILVDATASGFP
jgi:hypothetical protein